MRASRFPAAVLALSLILPATLGAQSAEAERDVWSEIEALKKGQEEMRRELQQIKQSLQSRQPSGPNVRDVEFDLGSNPVKGDDSAMLTLIEFADYQCGFCARHLNQTYPQIVSEYVDTGKVRYTIVDMPLDRHPLAFKAAAAAHCAGEQGKYWEMHDRLFANQRALEPWGGHADAIGLDRRAFDECMESGRQDATVRRNMVLAGKASVQGTPSFVLARTGADDPSKVKGLRFIRGAQPFNAFKSAIDAELEAAE